MRGTYCAQRLRLLVISTESNRGELDMLHPFYIGNFDPDALRNGKFIVTKPLDMAFV